MNRLAGPAFALLMSATSSVYPSAQSAPEKVDPWVPMAGARATTSLDALLMRGGAVRTNRLYSDFVFEFEFRLIDAQSEGDVMVRSRFGYGNSPTSVRGYRVALNAKANSKDALGRVTAIEMHLKETAFEPVRAPWPADAWQECEIRAQRDKLTVKINGSIASTIEGLDEFTGYLALESTSGAGVAFRNLRATRLPQAHDPFGEGAHPVSEPGVAPPQKLEGPGPFYPREPYDANVQGNVGLVVVVQADGSVGDIRVAKPLEPNLDEAAIASARRWRFKPGTKDGQPVDVIVRLDISFSRGR
jgi:TonB family protein